MVKIDGVGQDFPSLLKKKYAKMEVFPRTLGAQHVSTEEHSAEQGKQQTLNTDAERNRLKSNEKVDCMLSRNYFHPNMNSVPNTIKRIPVFEWMANPTIGFSSSGTQIILFKYKYWPFAYIEQPKYDH